ncbi:MAG TPA: acyltransferase [Coleofasciculaceae cyanobacterium]
MKQAEKQKELLRNKTILQQLKLCGHGVRLNGKMFISHPQNMIIGHNVHINENAYFSSAGGLTIGDNAHISRNVTIYTVNHNYHGEALPYDNTEIGKPVVIGKNVWIGMNVCIVPGVRIGDGAIIGLGAVVTQDIPSLAIVGNQPSRVLKYRDAKHYQNLESKKCYGGVRGQILVPEQLEYLESNQEGRYVNSN